MLIKPSINGVTRDPNRIGRYLNIYAPACTPQCLGSLLRKEQNADVSQLHPRPSAADVFSDARHDSDGISEKLFRLLHATETASKAAVLHNGCFCRDSTMTYHASSFYGDLRRTMCWTTMRSCSLWDLNVLNYASMGAAAVISSMC